LLEGLTPPRASLRLARGPNAPSGEFAHRSRDRDPSGESLPHSRPPRPTTPHLLSRPKHLILWHAAGARVKGESPSRRPPDTPGNHIPALFHQPSLCCHPRRCAGAVREGWCHFMTLCRPLPYLLHIAPLSKEDSGTLEGGIATYPTPARDGAVTLD
jgi:hypothetical protein